MADLQSRMPVNALQICSRALKAKSSPLLCRASEDAKAAKQDKVEERMPFSYQLSNGRRKASLEDAMSRDPKNKNRSVLMNQQPWKVGWQVSERNLVWNDHVAAALVKRVAAEQLKCSEEELEQKFSELTALLPGISERMHTIKADSLAKLVENPANVAEKLIQLKAIFPQANVEQMVLRDFRLLLGRTAKETASAAAELKEFLPKSVQIDRLCQEHPSMLEIKSFKDAVNEAQRLMPKLDIADALNKNPEIIFSTQRHESMIPYDPVPKSNTA